MKHAEKIRLIETYYRGDISPEDRQVFDSLIKEDSTFQEEVNSYESIFLGFEALHLENFENQLLSFEKKHQNTAKVVSMNSTTAKTTVVRPIKKMYYAAAAVAVLLVALFGYNQMNYAPFENNFVADANIAIHLSSMRAGSQDLKDDETLTRDAYAAYQSKDYASTIQKLEKYQLDFPEIANKDYQSFLVLGVAYLADGNAEGSIPNFNKILEAKDSSNKLSAKWYLSLAEIKLKNYEKATQLLNELKDSDDSKISKDAKALLNEL